MSSELEKQLKKKVEETWKKAIRDLPLTDDVCSMLFDCHKNRETNVACPTNIPTYLHICANTPPCDEKEEEMETNGRKWCKGRGDKYGTPEFDEKVEKMIENYRKKMDNEVKQIPEEGRQKAGDIVEEFQHMDVNSLFSISILEQKNDLPTNTNLSKKLQKKAKKEAEEKVKYDCARDILLDTSDMIKSQMVLISQKPESQKIQESNEQFVNEMRKMFESLNNKIDIAQEQNEKSIEAIQNKQDKTLKGIVDLNVKQDYIEFRDVWYKSKMAFFKKILEAPKKAVKIFLSPMNVAFDYWMKPLLVIIGTLQIICFVGIILYMLSCIDMIIPSFSKSLVNIMIDSWKWSMTKLSFGAYYLRDNIFSESQLEMISTVITTGQNASAWIMSIFATIKQMMEALFSLVALKDRLSKGWFG